MNLRDLLGNDAVIAGVRPAGKKQALHLIASRAAGICALDAAEVHEAIIEREKLGSTGFGGGIAIPHARSTKLEAITGFFFRLDQPIDFDAIDDAPVDLIFLLLAPEEDGSAHLRALAQVSRILRRPDMRQKIRQAPSEEAITALLCGDGQSDAA